MPTTSSLPTEEPEREAINGRLLFGVQEIATSSVEGIGQLGS
jgi:hypothetical protein